MKLINKMLIVFLVVLVVVSIICFDIHRRNLVPVESFQDFQTTIATVPIIFKEGDSSITSQYKVEVYNILRKFFSMTLNVLF